MVSTSPESFITYTSHEGKDGYFKRKGQASSEGFASLGFSLRLKGLSGSMTSISASSFYKRDKKH